MGYGNYDDTSRSSRAATSGYLHKTREELFSSSLHSLMDPKNFKFRECRDNPDHPSSFPIIFGLDETGSMGEIPHQLLKDGIPTIMNRLIHHVKVPDASLCFLGLGDHLNDRAPLQVGQFEANDEAMDNWLTKLWLEGKGGGNGGESYMLAWYFAHFMTVCDNWEKRKQKGVIITVGDEPCHPMLQSPYINRFTGRNEEKDYSSKELFELASEKWEIYHLNLAGRGLTDIIGTRNIDISDYHSIPAKIEEIIAKVAKQQVKTEVVTSDTTSEEGPKEEKANIKISL